MLMTSFEIRQEYKLAKNPKAQIKILAELNCCHINDIKDVLRGIEVVKPRKVFRHSSDEAKMELYKKGKNDYEIGRELNIAPTAICYWRKKNGLKAIGKKGNHKC
ncbi:MAG: hypothetical protein E7432_04290 [Ruminococcaceae bacterium]|nr:hypothetical protein [Oscillospiraceae bacterium]